jgi:hypothetical protein
MVIIGQNRRYLRSFFDGNSCKIVGPVIQIKLGLTLQISCEKWLGKNIIGQLGWASVDRWSTNRRNISVRKGFGKQVFLAFSCQTLAHNTGTAETQKREYLSKGPCQKENCNAVGIHD